VRSSPSMRSKELTAPDDQSSEGELKGWCAWTKREPAFLGCAADQKSSRRESCPVRLPLFSAVCTLWTMPNEDEVTFVGGGAKFG